MDMDVHAILKALVEAQSVSINALQLCLIFMERDGHVDRAVEYMDEVLEKVEYQAQEMAVCQEMLDQADNEKKESK